MLAAVGQPVPDIPHAVSVSLPSWKAVVGYEEGEEWVVSKMKTGYPRFFIHLIIQELEKEIVKLHGHDGEHVMLFPSQATAKRCQQFLSDKHTSSGSAQFRILHLEPTLLRSKSQDSQTVLSGLHCVFFPKDCFSIAKQVWQHSGDGISSRRGEFCLQALREGFLQPVSSPVATPTKNDLLCKGPRRYQRGTSQNGINFYPNGHHDTTTNGHKFATDEEHAQFIEERFGRNLNAKLAAMAKQAIRRRISGSLVVDGELDQTLAQTSQDSSLRLKGLSEDDVYLYPTGMSAIFNSYRILMARAVAIGQEPRKAICFGFPYIDTLKILEKWGPGCLFYGNGQSEDLDDLEKRLEGGERFSGLYTEFPSNPLLRSPDLVRIRQLADKYDFAVVVDETVGNFINTHVLQYADVVVSSLTKVFSGDSNVMGGSYVLNPDSRMYETLRQTNDIEYEDNYWAEDAVYMERNSRDFIPRIHRINRNADRIVDKLQSCPIVKQVYYPKVVASRPNYDACRNPDGGYGGLLSVTFQRPDQAVVFFDALEAQKGPSLGTNFTLACPYTILAHYLELDWTRSFGVEPDLVRISVGLEDESEVVGTVERALNAALRV